MPLLAIVIALVSGPHATESCVTVSSLPRLEFVSAAHAPTPPSAWHWMPPYDQSDVLERRLAAVVHTRPNVSDANPLRLPSIQFSGLVLSGSGITWYVVDRRTGRRRPIQATVSRRGVRLRVRF